MSRAIVRELERALGARGTRERAAGAKAYLKSDLRFLGVGMPTVRRAVRDIVREQGGFERAALLELVEALWSRGVFELRAAAVEILVARVELLEPRDLQVVERLLRDARTWALVDALAPRVVGPLVARHPELEAVLDRWAEDPDFWLRRAALLADLPRLRRGGGEWRRFTRYADRMLEDKEFFIRKAIGWVLREVGKKRPGRVTGWLTSPRRAPRAGRAAGLTLREAVKYLPADDRTAIFAARRKT